MTLQECKENIGKKVTYIPFKGCDPELYEYGVITSANEKCCFVRYWTDINSKATRPEDLILD